MRIMLDLKKSVEENASEYFEKAKKSRKKVKGAEEAVQKLYMRLEKEEKRLNEAECRRQQKEHEMSKPKRKQEWYEKFRWFISSEGFLVIGGRDATTNEIIIKKHTEKNDIVFHTDMAGSPFFVVKNPENKKIGDATLIEVSDAVCTYSRAWKLGLGTSSVFWVKPDQVSKEANPGEFMGKGAFMIRGKTNYVPAKISLAVGLMDDSRVMGGPLDSVKKHCKPYFELIQGSSKTAAVAKILRSRLSNAELDDLIKVIPAGGAEIK